MTALETGRVWTFDVRAGAHHQRLLVTTAGRLAMTNAQLLQALNERHAVVLCDPDSRCRVLSWGTNCGGELFPVLESFRAFCHRYMNRSVRVGTTTKGTPSLMPLGKWWLQHERRRQHLGLRWLPDQPPVVDGFLNLWRGHGIEPRPGVEGAVARRAGWRA